MDFPLGLGNRLTTLHKPLAVSDFDFAELMEDRNSSSERNKILIYIKCQ
jgi:hypothetical protein